MYEQAYLWDKVLNVELLGQKIYALVILIGIAKLSSIEVIPLTLPPRLQVCAYFPIACLTENVVRLWNLPF